MDNWPDADDVLLFLIKIKVKYRRHIIASIFVLVLFASAILGWNVGGR